jgi:hypothetical protein
MTIFLYANWLTATALMAELVSWTNHSATGEIAQLVLVPNQSRENPGKAFGSFYRLNKAFFPADDARDNQKFWIGENGKGGKDAFPTWSVDSCAQGFYPAQRGALCSKNLVNLA